MTFIKERCFGGFGCFLLVLVILFHCYFVFLHSKAQFFSPLKYNESYLVAVSWVVEIHVCGSEYEGKAADWKYMRNASLILTYYHCRGTQRG